jgi:predicted Zn-dependent protease
MLDRREKRADAAARLFAEMKARWPNEAEVQVLAAESRLRDANDPTGALTDIDAGVASIQDPRIKRNATLLRAYAFLALGQKDSARAVVERLALENPANARYRTLADSLK